jgi:hypothetical protein
MMELTIPDQSSLLGDLAALDSWLAALGVPSRSTDRIHQLVRLLTELKPQSAGAAVKITTEQRRAYMYALAELIEFHQIYTQLRTEDPHVLRPKLLRALSGTLDPADESISNSVGRNTTFELALAAEWRRAGVSVTIGEPDMKVMFDQQEFLVECKRPFDWSGVSRGMKGANRQLKKNGATPRHGAAKGVIAISLSRVIANGEQIFFADTMSDKVKLQGIIERSVEANRWRWSNNVRIDDSIAAVLFHLTLPADIGGGDHFALLSFSNVYQASRDPRPLVLLNQAMEPLYRDSTARLMKVHPPDLSSHSGPLR